MVKPGRSGDGRGRQIGKKFQRRSRQSGGQAAGASPLGPARLPPPCARSWAEARAAARARVGPPCGCSAGFFLPEPLGGYRAARILPTLVGLMSMGKPGKVGDDIT